ncbi:MAG: HEPN domain-containing protein [Anaerolineales bacterium]|nr:HEPN domain-containing protein [Anaerolineales bacterium]
MKGPREHAQALLRKAANDLVAAQATLTTGRATDTICFHAQQAAEKSLKAILALHEIEYPWRHDLGELLELAQPIIPEISPYYDRIINLSPFAVEIRYDAEFEPPLPDAEAAVKTAIEVHNLITSLV